MGDGGERELVLAFEVMKKAAFGHLRLMTDVIDRRGRVTLGPDDLHGRIQQLGLRSVLTLSDDVIPRYSPAATVPCSRYVFKRG
jgi:hypothetical protein